MKENKERNWFVGYQREDARIIKCSDHVKNIHEYWKDMELLAELTKPVEPVILDEDIYEE